MRTIDHSARARTRVSVTIGLTVGIRRERAASFSGGSNNYEIRKRGEHIACLRAHTHKVSVKKCRARAPNARSARTDVSALRGALVGHRLPGSGDLIGCLKQLTAAA